ncbi:homoserine dehydrogenase [Sedimentibacter sp.]|uniref:homoserine dehydrogenase n=1 Tax=Sedimentibacter sp. TaxID=1960295 RepID=UPI0028A893F2|nr:homoserine dehydrogenase [Sedimentibacter sp.]
MKSINLGILGMGTVASGLISIIEFNNTKIVGNIDKQLVISKVLVKDISKKRSVNLPADTYTTDAYEIINNKDIQIIVELIGGINPAYEYIRNALNNKKHVVTANKALLATHGEELEQLAHINGVRLMYEASVGGGIPIINTITENLSANEFEHIAGIINGTTNYILTQMTENGLEYEQAVKEAQRLGFAEADPSSDVDGDDAAYKIAILSSIAFDQRISVSDIPKEGITKISKEDIIYAKELGYNIKLLASASKSNNEIELRVHPAFVPSDHPLSTVKNEFNAVFLKGNAVGEIMLYGKGAGSLPTGSAVLNDIVSIVKNESRKYAESINADKYKIVNRAYKKYYIRFEVIDKPGVLARIASVFGKNNISLDSVVQRQKNGNNTAPLVFITHDIERKNIDNALKEISNFDCVIQIASIIVVEDF